MHQLTDSGMLTAADKKTMKKNGREIKEKEAQLRRLKSEAIRQKKRQEVLKIKIVAAAVANPDLAV